MSDHRRAYESGGCYFSPSTLIGVKCFSRMCVPPYWANPTFTIVALALRLADHPRGVQAQDGVRPHAEEHAQAS